MDKALPRNASRRQRNAVNSCHSPITPIAGISWTRRLTMGGGWRDDWTLFFARFWACGPSRNRDNRHGYLW